MPDEHRIDRMAGCACLGKSILGMTAVALAFYCVLNLHQCFFMTCGGLRISRDQHMIKDLRVSITAFEIETNRFPILKPDPPGLDVSVRSRGLMLPILSGQEDKALNPKSIKFIDLPPAKDRKYGLWQEGTEWVLSDSWGEPYYLVFDTSKDGQITNPEFGADQTDPTYAAKCKLNPPPATIQSSVLIYSSGPDRDPKTWNDNICSWRN